MSKLETELASLPKSRIVALTSDSNHVTSLSGRTSLIAVVESPAR